MKKLVLSAVMMLFLALGGLSACSVDCEWCYTGTTVCATTADVDSADCDACNEAVTGTQSALLSYSCTEV
ncbi:MAG: hypothetical protein OEZ36_03890 [Spirochaetota bacterium]|nr:hypothetical protein [Spirochaetota bacterium]